MYITLAFQVGLSDNATLRSKIETSAIKWWTKSKYFHIEMIIEDQWISSSPVSGGVHRHKLKDLSEKYEYITIKVDGRKLRKVQDFIDSQVGTGYDWMGIFFSQTIELSADDKTKWFCSEIVAEILKIFGEDLELHSNEYSPGELYEIYKN